MAADPLRRWKRTAFVASLIVVLTIAVYMVKERLVRSPSGDTNTATATFVGRDNCVSCHREAYGEWLGSHHDRAMAVAADSTVLGDFDDTAFEHGGITSRFYRKDGKYFVHTQGPDGGMDDFEIAYTFGVEPLQQYLIPFPGGRYQALSIAWDSERGGWFHLYPDQDIPPDELSLSELDDPREIRLQRRRRFVDVVAVERHLRLQAKRIACPETNGEDPV